MSTLREQVSRFKLVVLLLIVVILGLVGFMASRQFANTKPELVTIKPQVRNVQEIVTADGKLTGIDQRALLIPAGAVVKEVYVHVGQNVPQDADLLKYKLNNINFKLKSNIAGRITQLNYKAEDNVWALTQPAVVITDTSEYRVELAINETDVVNLKFKQQATLTYTAISLDDVYPGKVVEIAPAPIDSTNTVNYKVLIWPTKLPDKVKLGMSVDASIVTNEADNVIAIPENYLIEKDSKFYVRIVTWKDTAKTDYTTEDKEVKIGLRTDEYVEIKSGVTVDDEILEPTFNVTRRFGFF